jgi:CBS domain-containing protein
MTRHRRVTVTDLEQFTVAEAMLPSPKTLPPDATVADVRRLFERPTMRTVVIVDGTRFVGAIDRGDVPESARDEAPAAGFAQADGTVLPDTPVADALDRLAREGGERLVVIDPDGVTLRGLLCLTEHGTQFCVGP